MSSTMPFSGRRLCTQIIHDPPRSASTTKFSSSASQSVSKRPIWQVEAACFVGTTTIYPAHRRIAPKLLGVVYVRVSGKAAEHRLPQHSDQIMLTVRARASISKMLPRDYHQASTSSSSGNDSRPASEVSLESCNPTLRRRPNLAEESRVPIHPLGAS